MKRVLVALVGVVVIVGLVTSCGPAATATPTALVEAPTPTPKPAEKVKITVWQDSGAAFDTLITRWNESFAKEHPNIELEWVGQAPLEISTKLITAFSAGGGPDVCISEMYRVLQAELELEQWQDLTSYIENDPEFKEIVQGLVVGSTDEYQRGEKLWGMPNSVNRYALFIRKSWMEAVGWTKPYPYLEDFNDLMELAKRFTFQDPDGNGVDDTIGYGTKKGPYDWTAFMDAAGENTCHTLDEEGRPIFNNNLAIEVAAFVQDMMRQQVISPDSATWTFKEYYQAVDAGKVGMGLAGQWNVPGWDTTLQEDYVIVPYPPMVKGQTSYAMQWTDSITVNSKSKHLPESIEFLKWFLDKEAQTIFFEEFALTCRSDLDWDTLIGDNANQKFYYEAHPNWGWFPELLRIHPLHARYEQILTEQLARLLTDLNLDPAVVLADAEEQCLSEWETWKAQQP